MEASKNHAFWPETFFTEFLNVRSAFPDGDIMGTGKVPKNLP
jgi:hypothetical protein